MMAHPETIPEDERFGLDAVLAGIRAHGRWWAKEQGDSLWLGECLEPLIHPPRAFTPPAPWFRWCRYSEPQPGVGHWLSLEDPLEPLLDVQVSWALPNDSGLSDHNHDWIAAALLLAKLAREASDVAYTGLTPEEEDGFDAIAARCPTLPRPALWDLYCWYRDLPREPQAELCVALPLVDPVWGEGVLADLRLALMPQGTGTLYRAHTLAFAGVGEDFQGAIAAAQAALAPAGLIIPPDQDLRWEVRRRATGAIPQALVGASCGGAFGLGLRLLLAGTRADPRHGALGPLRPEELSGIAITATVNAAGKLGPIAGEIAKLQAAAEQQWLPRTHTFVVADAQPGLDRSLDDPHAGLCVKWSEDLDTAEVRVAQQLQRRHFDRAHILDYRTELRRHTHFVGRDWLFGRLDEWVAAQPSGYLLLQGDKGYGKSAILAALVRREADGQRRVGAYHFIQRSGAWQDPLTFFPSLVCQLRRHLALPPLADEEPSARSTDPQRLTVLWQERLRATLDQVSRALRVGQKLLLILDALDEAFPDAKPGPMARDLFTHWLPKALPEGIFIVLGSRRGGHLPSMQRLDSIEHWDLGAIERHLADRPLWQDMAEYLALRDRELCLLLDPAFRAELVAVFAGNFQLAEMSLRVPPRTQGGLDGLRRKLADWRAHPQAIHAQLDQAIAGEWDALLQALEGRGLAADLGLAVLGMLVCAREVFSRVTLGDLLATLDRPPPLPGLPALGPITRLSRITASDILGQHASVLDLAWAFLRSDPDAGLGAPQALAFYHASFSEFVAHQLDRRRARGALESLLAQLCGHWSALQEEARAYALRYLPHHLCEAGHWDALYDVLTDAADYLPARIALAGEAGSPALMADYRRTLAAWPQGQSEQRRELEDVHRILDQAGHRLAPGREAVIQVLYNALTGLWDGDTALGQRLREAADAAPMPWFRLLNPPKQLSPLVRFLLGQREPIIDVEFSPRDRHGNCWLAAVDQDGYVWLWDLQGREESRVLDTISTTPLPRLAFSPRDAQGRCWLATGRGPTARLWDLDGQEAPRVLEGHSHEIITLAFSLPDTEGRCWLATGSRDGTARLWDLEGQEALQVLEGHTGEISCLAFSPPDAESRCWLATGSSDGTVRLWDLARREAPQVLGGHTGEISRLAFSPSDPDGRCWIATGSDDGTVRLWNLDGREPSRVLEFYGETINHLSFSPPDPDGRFWLMILSGDNTVVRMLDPAGREAPRVLWGHEGRIMSFSFSPPNADGRRWLATGSWDGTVRLWDPAVGWTPRLSEGHTGKISCLAFSPPDAESRCWLATGSIDQTVRLWDPAGREAPQVLEGHTGEISCLAFSPPDAKGCCWLATGSRDGTVRLWDPAGREPPQVLEGHTGEISRLALSPSDADGRCWLATGSSDGMVRLWNTAGGAPRALEGHADSIRTLAFSPPDARGCCWLAIGRSGGTIRLWGTAGGAPRVLSRKAEFHAPLAFSPPDAEGHCWLAANCDGRAVRLWDLAGREPPRVLKVDPHMIEHLALSPPDAEGRCLLAAADHTGTVFLYDLTAECFVGELPCHWRMGKYRDKVLSPKFDCTGRLLTIVRGMALEVWDSRSRNCLASVWFDKLRATQVDPANPNSIVAACIDSANHRPIFHHLHSENLSLA